MNLKFSIILFFLVMAGNVAIAQHDSNGGRFTVDQIKGCAPLTVNITSINNGFVCTPGAPCEMYYEAVPGFQQLDFDHEFKEPGVYNVIVLFQGGLGTDQITITVTPNVAPEFEIYSCGNNEVRIKLTDTNYPEYEINFNDGSPIVEKLQGDEANHTFISPGNKTITINGRNRIGDNCITATKTVNAVATLPAPTITQLTVLNNADIQLDFNNELNILYRLQIAVNNSTNFQNLQNIYEVSSTTINNLNADNNFYCFRLGAFDPCNNTTVYSNTICSSNFDLNVLNNNNRLTWTTSSAGVSNYSITKNSDPPLNAASSSTSLDDTNTTCGVEYCYQQTSNYVNGSKSISLIKCGTAISTDIPTVVENISTIVGTESSVELQWTQDPNFIVNAYAITKFVNGSVASVDSSSTTSYIDDAYLTDVTVDTTSCYKIAYQDVCDNKSPISVEACPIQLTGSLQENNAAMLSWNTYAGWKNGVDHYVIEKFDEQGQLLFSANTTSPTYVDNVQDLVNQVSVYRTTATPNDAGIVPSVSNTITIIKDPNLFYPTAFTPNGDGLNDIFNVFGQFITEFEMKIFNRWGEMMYATEAVNQGWDGMFKGSLVPEGTYVFRARITDQAGRTFDRSGTVVLLKKN